jgi:hypothetical protein
VPSHRKRDSEQSTKGVPITTVLAGITMSVDGYIPGPNDGPGKVSGRVANGCTIGYSAAPGRTTASRRGTDERARCLASRGGFPRGRRCRRPPDVLGGRALGRRKPLGCRSSSSRTGPRTMLKHYARFVPAVDQRSLRVLDDFAAQVAEDVSKTVSSKRAPVKSPGLRRTEKGPIYQVGTSFSAPLPAILSFGH